MMRRAVGRNLVDATGRPPRTLLAEAAADEEEDEEDEEEDEEPPAPPSSPPRASLRLARLDERREAVRRRLSSPASPVAPLPPSPERAAGPAPWPWVAESPPPPPPVVVVVLVGTWCSLVMSSMRPTMSVVDTPSVRFTCLYTPMDLA
jgi:hypothetical protein